MNDFFTLSNDVAALNAEGWALLAPFGEHPKSRTVRKNGAVQEEKFIQVLDQEAAARLLSRENSLFRRIRRAVVGIPVYKGHPDLRVHSPETVQGGRGRAEQIGVIDQVRQTARGIEAHFVLSPAGADAVEKEGCKYPSALWLVEPIGQRGGATLARPFKLLSAGLTAHPNICGVESLANARSADTQKTHKPDMKLIAGWLLAQGATLADSDSPTELEVLDALQKLHTAQAGDVVSLANEKSTLAGQLNALEQQVASLKTSRAGAVADLAIAKGKLALAERETRIAALANATDFEKDAAALLGAATRFKTIANAESGKVLSNHRAGGDAREEYCAAVERFMKESGEADPIKAHRAVLKTHPALAEAFKPQP